MKSLEYESTFVHPLNNISREWNATVYAKRDDRFILDYGGSKARILRYIMYSVLKKNTEVIITAGGPCSNFLRALSLECAQKKIELWIVSYTDRKEEYKSLNYSLVKKTGAIICKCEKKRVKERIDELISVAKSKNLRWEYIYGGAEGSIEGMWAYYDAVKELCNQLSDRELKRVSEIWVPVGTGTTVSGLSFGCSDYLPNVRLYGVSVARSKENVWESLHKNRKKFCDSIGKEYNIDNVTIIEKCGYSEFDKNVSWVIEEMMKHEGIVLDGVYSGRAACCLKEKIKKEKIGTSIRILWITGGLINGISGLCYE